MSFPDLAQGIPFQVTATPAVYLSMFDPDLDGFEEEGGDLFRALRIAKIVARPYLPARRTLKLAERWVNELLCMVDVWEAIEGMTETLLVRGRIDGDEAVTACDAFHSKMTTLPQWRRRLGLDQQRMLNAAS